MLACSIPAPFGRRLGRRLSRSGDGGKSIRRALPRAFALATPSFFSSAGRRSLSKLLYDNLLTVVVQKPQFETRAHPCDEPGQRTPEQSEEWENQTDDRPREARLRRRQAQPRRCAPQGTL